MRKLIVRRSEVERMLAAVNPAPERKVPGPEPSVSSGDEPDVPVRDELTLQGLPPPAGTHESVKELVDACERKSLCGDQGQFIGAAEHGLCGAVACDRRRV